MGIIISALKIIFVLGFLIFIHEGGHFLVAKACKVKVKEFCIGFGPKILKYQGKETKYSLRLIPFGGFVDMLGEAERRDEEGSFSNASVPRRFAIVVAGATVNIIFGLVVYFSLMAIDFNEISFIVDKIGEEYSQNLSELKENDEIVSINGKRVHLKFDLDSELSKLKDENVVLEVKRNNEIKKINVKATKKVNKSIGIYFGSGDNITSKIQYVMQDSPAGKAGIKVNDKIIGINGIKTEDPYEISKNIITDKVDLEIQRNDEIINISVVPNDVESYLLGVSMKKAESNFANRIYYGYWESVSYLKSIGQNLIMIFTGNVNMNQMMGPIGISDMIVQTKGISDFIYLLSIISLSLGVSNLLPIPALDGGRLLLLIIEAIRRKPLKQETEISIQMIGFSLLIMLSLYISFNDIIRIF